MLSKDKLRELSKPSFARWITMVAMNWAVIAGTFYAFSLYPNWFVGLLAVIVLGSRQHAFGVYGHEVAHRMVGLPRLASDILGNLLCYYPINISLSGYRKFHLDHHFHLGHDVKDPEQIMKSYAAATYKSSFTPLQFCMVFVRRSFLMDFQDTVAFKKVTKSTSKIETLFYFVFWASVIAVTWQQNLWMYFGLWAVANLTTTPAFGKIRALTEHPFKTETYRMQIPFWMKFFFPGNIDIHFEHHNYPSIPFYKLPEARKAIGPEPKIHSVGDYLELMKDIKEQAEKRYQIEAEAETKKAA
jgi:fatty acid desaturase